MSRKENKKEVQVSREYNLLSNGKKEKNSYANGKQGTKTALESNHPIQSSSTSNNSSNQQKGQQPTAISNLSASNQPYKKEDTSAKLLQSHQTKFEEKKVDEEKLPKKNGNSDIQQILKSSTEAKNQQEQEEDEDDDDVEFEIVSYEDSSDDEKSNHIEEECLDNEEKCDVEDQSREETVNAAQQLGLRVNTSSENEAEGRNESGEEDIFSEYAKVGQGYIQFNLPKLIKEINLMEDNKKEVELQNQQIINQQQGQSSSSTTASSTTFDKTRNKQAQNKQTAALQQQQEIQTKSRQQRIQYCHQQITQKKTIVTRSSGNNSKGTCFISKMSYTNTNNSIGSDYQPKYISSRKRRSVTDPELESLGLYNLNKRRDNKPNNRYNEESETQFQEYDENSEGAEENSKTRRIKQQQTKPKNAPRNNSRNNEPSHQKPAHTPAQNKKKIEQNLDAADDDIADVPVTLSKDQQMELLKYHKRSKNYHGTAKQFNITHEEARVIVKKLKKEYRSIQNY